VRRCVKEQEVENDTKLAMKATCFTLLAAPKGRQRKQHTKRSSGRATTRDNNPNAD
jgi:hypothetical protein